MDTLDFRSTLEIWKLKKSKIETVILWTQGGSLELGITLLFGLMIVVPVIEEFTCTPVPLNNNKFEKIVS